MIVFNGSDTVFNTYYVGSNYVVSLLYNPHTNETKKLVNINNAPNQPITLTTPHYMWFGSHIAQYAYDVSGAKAMHANGDNLLYSTVDGLVMRKILDTDDFHKSSKIFHSTLVDNTDSKYIIACIGRVNEVLALLLSRDAGENWTEIIPNIGSYHNSDGLTRYSIVSNFTPFFHNGEIYFQDSRCPSLVAYNEKSGHCSVIRGVGTTINEYSNPMRFFEFNGELFWIGADMHIYKIDSKRKTVVKDDRLKHLNLSRNVCIVTHKGNLFLINNRRNLITIVRPDFTASAIHVNRISDDPVGMWHLCDQFNDDFYMIKNLNERAVLRYDEENESFQCLDVVGGNT